MERRMLPVGLKPSNVKDLDEESSDDESSSSEEKDVKRVLDLESETDESTDTSKHTAVSNGKPPQLVPAKTPTSGSPTKRRREKNGNDNQEELAHKKKKLDHPVEKVTSPPRPSSTKLAQQTGSKGEKVQPQGKARENAAKPEKNILGTPSKTDKKKQKKSLVEKEKKSEKSKGLSLEKVDVQKPASSGKVEGEKENDKSTPQKPKKPPQPWMAAEELALSNLLLRDTNKGIEIPHSRQDNYWDRSIKELPFMEKYDKDARTRIYDKVRRMRERYEVLVKRIKEDKNVWKNSKEESLFKIWCGIWAPDKEDAEDKEDESDESDEELEKPQEPALNGNLVVALGSEPEVIEKVDRVKQDADAQKKIEVNPPGAVAVREVSESSSEDEESDKEETTPVVKGKPPSSLVTQPQPSSIKPIQEATPLESLQVELHQEGKNVNGDILTLNRASPEKAGERQEEGLSEQMHFKGLALLGEIRSNCLTMVNEARTQSNLMVEEAQAKCIQMVDEAHARSIQIMEDLHAIGEKLRMVAGIGAGQIGNGYMPGVGVWGGVLDVAFPLNGHGFVSNGASSEENSLQQQWHEQYIAEQGLVLQRLQLVQEQARIQQEGIRLQSQSLELRRKQSESKQSLE